MSQHARGSGGRSLGAAAAALTFAIVASTAWVAPAAAAGPRAQSDAAGGLRPTIHYEEALAHADDEIAFAPGGRVTVGFEPRRGDSWKVGGVAPRALPAGRLDGTQLRRLGNADAAPGQARERGSAPDPTATPSPETEPLSSPTPSAEPTPAASEAPSPEPSAPLSDIDQPIVDPGAIVNALGTSWSSETLAEPSAPTATVSSSGLRREVFGFLPYWELNSSSTTLDYSKLSTIAFFGVGIDGAGNLMKKNSDGTTTVGWSGWTSSRMTSVINAAHQNHTRVVLTVQSFGWTSGQLDRQRQFLGSSTARTNLARQVAAAVRDRGADGVNLDLEPLASGYGEEFTALVRSIRAELNRIRSGYQLTFDTTGFIGNYPIEAATASGGADAVFIMGYDYRSAGSSPVGSVAPLTRSGYDIRETVAAYVDRVAASKLILGVPYYGRAWSTDSDDLHAANISGTKYGASSTVVYETAVTYTAKYGRRYDATEGVAWTAYKRENCTTTYGCVTPWRQLYFDDSQALRAKYDLVNQYNLRGAGIWALGYDGTRSELWKAIGDKFAPDTRPPVVGIRNLAAVQPNPLFTVSWKGTDASGIASYDTQISINGEPWKTWLTSTTATSATYPSLEGRGYAFRVRARDVKGNISTWSPTSRWVSSPTLATDGFGRVTVDGLSLRASASTSAAKVGEVDSGDILAVTGGPTSSGGYVWHRVSGPLREWGAVSDIQRNVWVATRNSTTRFVVAAPGPHTTFVRPVIAGLGFGPGGSGSIGTSATAVAARSFSPDADGSKDTLRISWANARDLDDLEIRIFDADGDAVATLPLSGGRLAAGAHGYNWDGSAGGSRLPDGLYLVTLVGSTGGTTYSNPSPQLTHRSQLATHAVRIDVVNPEMTASADPAAFSPNGDGDADRTSLRWSSNESLTGRVEVRSAATVVRSWAFATLTSRSIAWDGRSASGKALPDGSYTVRVQGRDGAGNPVQRDVGLVLDRTLRAVSRTPGRFYPHDGDTLRPSTRLSYQLTRSARVTLQIVRGSTVIRTAYSGKSLAAGSYGWTWNGRNSSGAYVPRGFYTLRLTVTSPVSTTVRSQSVLADAFRTILSATTRTAGQKLSVTVTPVEPLQAAPRISLTQAGATTVTKTGVLLASGGYRATFTIAAGAPGTAKILVLGTDTRGGRNRSYASVVVK